MRICCRSPEIEQLRKDLEDREHTLELERIEKQALREQLTNIAEKEFEKKLQVLAQKGYDISGIVSTQDREEKVNRLLELETRAKIDSQGHAPEGTSETPTFEQIKNEPSKRQRQIDEAVRQALLDQGIPLDAIEYDSLEDLKETVRKCALDQHDPRNAEARKILNEWLEKGARKPFEVEYQGKITEIGKPRKIQKKGEWKDVSKKGEKE